MHDVLVVFNFMMMFTWFLLHLVVQIISAVANVIMSLLWFYLVRAVTFEFGSLFPWFIVSLCGTVLLGLANVKSVELEFAPAPFGLLLQLANVFIVGFCINELLIILVTGMLSPFQ